MKILKAEVRKHDSSSAMGVDVTIDILQLRSIYRRGRREGLESKYDREWWIVQLHFHDDPSSFVPCDVTLVSLEGGKHVFKLRSRIPAYRKYALVFMRVRVVGDCGPLMIATFAAAIKQRGI